MNRESLSYLSKILLKTLRISGATYEAPLGVRNMYFRCVYWQMKHTLCIHSVPKQVVEEQTTICAVHFRCDESFDG